MTSEPLGKGEPLDFIYVDRPKLAALHAQLFGLGTPIERKSSDEYKLSEDISENAGIPSIFGGKYRSLTEDSVSAERRFDLGWTNILETLTKLDDEGFISDGAAGTMVGSMMRLSGLLIMVDQRVLTKLWSPLHDVVVRKDPGVETENSLPMGEIVKHIAHPLVAQLITSETPGEGIKLGPSSTTNWGILNPDFVIGLSDSSALMNGGFCVGEYEMIAVLDVGLGANGFDASKLPSNNTFMMTLGIQQLIRTAFGRPDDANGVTPLVISRKLRRRVGKMPQAI